VKGISASPANVSPYFAWAAAIYANGRQQKIFHNYSIMLDTHIRASRITPASLKRTERDGQKKALSVGENLKLKRTTGVRFERSNTGLKWNDS
jgi:hypothetical protein